MNTFTLKLQDAMHAEDVTGVSCFVGEDDSGSFSILPRHARFTTSLTMGLARFRVGGENWQYLAVPGAVLYFNDDVLTLSTRRYLIDDNYERISEALQQQLLAEEENLHSMKQSLRHLEDEFLKRMWEMEQRSGGPGL